MRYLTIGLFGAAGALTRYLLGLWLSPLLPAGFPLTTLLINVTGSLLLGFLTAWGIERARLPEPWRQPITVGFIGSYTTFSTWTVDTVALLEAGHSIAAFTNVAVSLLLGLLAAALGYRLGQREA